MAKAEKVIIAIAIGVIALMSVAVLFGQEKPQQFTPHFPEAQPDDDALRHLYTNLNCKYFSGKLPDDENVTVVWSDTVENIGDVAGTLVTHFEGEPEKIRIEISSKIFRYEGFAVMSLLHEMVHVKIRAGLYKKYTDKHGREFQEEMLRLARLGAFSNRW